MGSTIKKIVEFPIKVVSKALSWLSPTPEIPEFGETDFDSFEKGILLNSKLKDLIVLKARIKKKLHIPLSKLILFQNQL